MNNILWLIRREIWENRSLWIAPLVVSGVILIAAAFGGIHVGGDGHGFFLGWSSDADSSPASADFSEKQHMYGKTIGLFTGIQLMTLGIVVFFYLLDSLLNERKDRSILFWKSLPVSDVEVVASKVLTGLVVAPVFVLLVSAATQIIFAPIWLLTSGMTAQSALMMAWDGGIWLKVQAAFWTLVPAVVVWYLPLAGYCLLVSVWARRNAFLWAILPPAAILMIEGLLTQSARFGSWLLDRFIGVFKIIAEGPDHSADEFADVIRRIGHVFLSVETWLGVLVAAALFVVIVRFRRYRDDS